MDSRFTIRPGSASDHPFVVDSWVMSFRSQSRAKQFGLAYLRDYKWFVRRLLDRVELRVCCLADDPDLIVGFAAVFGGHVSYVFVKRDFRRGGVAKALLEDFQDRLGVTYSHTSSQMLPIPETWAYEPMQDVRIIAG